MKRRLIGPRFWYVARFGAAAFVWCMARASDLFSFVMFLHSSARNQVNFRGSELQNYFTKILEDNLKAIIKPQYVDHIPKVPRRPGPYPALYRAPYLALTHTTHPTTPHHTTPHRTPHRTPPHPPGGERQGGGDHDGEEPTRQHGLGDDRAGPAPREGPRRGGAPIYPYLGPICSPYLIPIYLFLITITATCRC